MMTPLRQRMLEELQRRNYCSGTIRLYLRHVADFAQHFHRSPDQLGAEQIRQYQLFLIQQKKLAWSSYNQIVCALRFFYAKTLKRAFLLSDIPFSRKEQQLPLILSTEEVERILTAPRSLKSRALLMTLYAAGLRRFELSRLRVHDIDSARMTITVHQGKGQKDRVVMLSPVLLDTLRQYWRYNKPTEWLFPGRTPGQPISTNDIFMVFHNAVRRAGISKKVSPHSLRQASAYYTTFQSSFILKTIGLGQLQSAAVYGRSGLLRPEPAQLAIVDPFDR
jgi:integrase/recombinase XerD